jgi:uncharacterized protein YdeI (YjbR/CyaY-like superfamily)
MISQIEDYFDKGCGRCPRFNTPDCSTQRWAAGLAQLREICRAVGLMEAVKWGHPCYMWGDRNIPIFGAFRDDFRISFMNATLLKDPQKVLVKRGPHTKTADMICFDDVTGVAPLAAIISAYLEEAIGYAKAGLKDAKGVVDVARQPELVDALDADPELAEAFENLTPGRQRGYVLHLAGTQTPATRTARIHKFRDKVFAGKGMSER